MIPYDFLLPNNKEKSLMLIQEITSKDDLHLFLQERGLKSIADHVKYECEPSGIINLRILEKTSDWLKRVKNDPNNIIYLIVNDDYSEFIFHQYTTGMKLIYSKNVNYGDATLISLLDLINSIAYSTDEFINTTIDNLFDIHPLVKAFYGKYKKLRAKLIKAITFSHKIYSGLKRDDKKKFVENYAQLLFDRLIFIYFIQAKGIIDEKFIQNHYEQADVDNDNFFQTYLLPISFEIFNTRKSERKDEFKEKFGQNLPFLNGGLFAPKYRAEQNGAPILYKKIAIDNQIWGEILSLFNSYNWTISEEDSYQKITPEIIGYIYENSMNDRNKTGSFYTPKHITKEICERAIYPYVLKKLNEPKSNKYSSLSDLLNKQSFSKKDKEAIDLLYQIVSRLKILDNACGSGAFLRECEYVLSELLMEIVQIIEAKLGGFLPSEITQYSNRRYAIKKWVITQCLYGIDIQEDAVEIAKLRLWMSLIGEMNSKNIENLEPLPNIDYNILTGNSLIGFIKFGKEGLKITNVDDLIEERNDLLKQYRNNHDYPKDIFAQIRDIDAILLPSLDRRYYDLYCYKKMRSGRRDINTFAEFLEKKPFHYGIEFTDVFRDGGFDIILGNPPYGQNTIKEVERHILKNDWNPHSLGKKNEGKTYNLSAVFIERSFYLLKKNGILGYIVNNSIARVNEFNGIRKFLLDYTNIINIVDEGNPFKRSNVTLEMITIIYQKIKMGDYKIIMDSKRSNQTLEVDVKPLRDCNRLILYYDSFCQYLLNKSTVNLISGKRGKDTEREKEESKTMTVPYLHSGKTVKKTYIDSQHLHYAHKSLRTHPRWQSEIDQADMMVACKITNKYRCTMKPKGYLVGNGVIKLSSEEDMNPYALMTLLNSSLIDFFIMKYNLNLSELTFNFYNSITLFTPIANKFNRHDKLFESIGLILHYCKLESEELYTYFKTLSDELTYELYFDDLVQTPNALRKIVEPLISNIKSTYYDLYWQPKRDESKLEKMKSTTSKSITEMRNAIESNQTLQSIRSNIHQLEWVQLIESNGA